MPAQLRGAALLAAGTVILLLTFVWERDFYKRLLQYRAPPDVDPEDERQALKAMRFERSMIEWIRVIGSLGMLGGILLAMFGD